MILDGFGLNDKLEGNAIKEAKTPNITSLMKEYPFYRQNTIHNNQMLQLVLQLQQECKTTYLQNIQGQ